MAHNRSLNTNSSNTTPSNQSTSMADIPTEVLETILTSIPNLTLYHFKSIILVNHFFLDLAINICFTRIDEKKWDELIKTKNRNQLNLFKLAKPELQNLHANYHTEFQKNNRSISKIDAIKIMAYALVTDDVSSLDPDVLQAAIQQLIPENFEALLKSKHDELESLKENKTERKKIKVLENELNALIHLYQFASDLNFLIAGFQGPQKVDPENALKVIPELNHPFFKTKILNFSCANLKDVELNISGLTFKPDTLNKTKFGKAFFFHCTFLKNDLSGKTLWIGNLNQSLNQNLNKMVFSFCDLDNTILAPYHYREGAIPSISLNGSYTSVVTFKEGETLKSQIDFLPHTRVENHRTVNTSVILQLHLLMNDINAQIDKLFFEKSFLGNNNVYIRDRYLAKADLLCQLIQHIVVNLDQPITTLYEAWAKSPSQFTFFSFNGRHIKEHFSIPDNISNFEFLNLSNDFSENISSALSTSTQSIFNFFNSSKPSDKILEKKNHSKETQDIAFIIKQSSQYTNEPQAQSIHQKTTENTTFDTGNQSTSPKLN